MSTLAGSLVLACTLTVPRAGVWVADVLVDSDTPIEGTGTLDLEGSTWRGTVTRGGVELGRWRGRIVGGAGGLAPVLGPAPFADCTLATVLGETLRDAGEELAADAGDLSAAVSRWARVAAPAAHTVADVAQAAGFTWRVRGDGLVWLGVETWEPLALGADLDVTSHDPRAGRWVLGGTAALAIVPGRVVTLDGAEVRVGAVEHQLDGVTLRTLVLEERATDPANRLLASIEGIVRRTMRRVDYLALYPAKVVAQTDDELDVEPDDASVQIPRRIAYRSLPGLTYTVPVGTRALVGFEGGDPARPYVALFEPCDATKLVVNGGTHEAARKGHAVRVTIPVGTVLVSSPGGPVPNAAPIPLDGTITEGTDVLLLP